MNRFHAILRSGAILPEPPIPDSERWFATADVNNLPYVRSIGGVSLFDFAGFPGWTEFGNLYPNSSLRFFVPAHRTWGTAVWIEIDRAGMNHSLIAPDALVTRWKAEHAHARAVMPGVEAAHLGPIARIAFLRAFCVDREKGEVSRLQLTPG
ncbi:MAG: hypothetical protein K2X11_03285 [Acetobacteraceae bacterium]|nr:hypothetical protein [Acetobacteraceae bacterium]